MSEKKRIIMLGPPGAGKGTQAALLAEALGIAHVSTGEMFRAAVESGSELGQKVSAILDRGDLVPDSLVIDLVMDRLEAEDCEPGYILDGFPRNLDQAQALGEALEAVAGPITKVFYIDVPKEELVNRVLARAQDGSGRSDDNREVIENRLQVYEEQTAPLVVFYRDRGVLAEINGVGEVGAITKLLQAEI